MTTKPSRPSVGSRKLHIGGLGFRALRFRGLGFRVSGRELETFSEFQRETKPIHAKPASP